MYKGWFKNIEGSTAVEFAIVGVPFIFLLVGLVEVSLMLAANSMLQFATTDAARLIRTGQVQQSSSDPEQMFKQELCKRVYILVKCTDIQYEVVTFGGGFSEAQDYQPQYDANGNLISQGFNPGGVSDVVMVRTLYNYPLMTPFIGPMLSDGPSQTKRMTSAVVLQTEPYEFDGT